ncbi:hypothetical protein P152DRAFT_452781 [Eremomyces bilateralis CBS 781.70]|uniref:F-box domain-containing protein n=1 Tax=Eremomyces bilateralis CBS 781.70 TaxID=1392243 RepID=A0A6G1FS57_9PEZI|nr:uncharacterized protein P152DRAFT_452781 [Eremomyces bilateralis CBS 781.70]KAF1808566.1 hypothetical protein P152DRAFT_452781 [Eremomyces bilateralis CBS 781.70]
MNFDDGTRPDEKHCERAYLQEEHHNHHPSLLDLPEEVRRQIFQELLVSDTSFRLGHHNLFSLGPHKSIHSSILATCRLLHQEGSPVLYGENSFHLGSIGFKPIYTASFDHCIGKRNAALIRRISFHANHTWQLDQHRIARALSALGINISDLRVLVFSFNPSLEPVKPAPQESSTGPPTPQSGHYHYYNPIFPYTSNTGALTLATNYIPMSFQWHYTSQFPSHPNPQPAPILTGTTPFTPLPSNTAPPPASITVPGHLLTTSDSSPDVVFTSKFGTILRSDATVALTHRTWLEPIPRSIVQRMVFLNGTDLRATEGWLVMRTDGPPKSRFRSEYRAVPGDGWNDVWRNHRGEEYWMVEEREWLEKLVGAWERMELEAVTTTELREALNRAIREVMLEMRRFGRDSGVEMDWQVELRMSMAHQGSPADGATSTTAKADVEMADVTLSFNTGSVDGSTTGSVILGTTNHLPTVVQGSSVERLEGGRRVID